MATAKKSKSGTRSVPSPKKPTFRRAANQTSITANSGASANSEAAARSIGTPIKNTSTNQAAAISVKIKSPVTVLKEAKHGTAEQKKDEQRVSQPRNQSDAPSKTTENTTKPKEPASNANSALANREAYSEGSGDNDRSAEDNQANSAEPTSSGSTSTPVGDGSPQSVQPQTSQSASARATTTENKKKSKQASTKKQEKSKSAQSPKSNPKFRKVLGRLNRLAQNEKSHEPAQKKLAAAQAAAEPPANDRSSQAQAGQVAVMDKQKAGRPDSKSFVELLRKAIKAIAPSTLKETEDFKKNGKAKELKAQMQGNVSRQKQSSTASIAQATENKPDASAIEAKVVTPLAADPKDPSPLNLRATDILPGPKTKDEISVDDNKQKLDKLMSDADIDDEQLARANEPAFNDALKSKKDFEQHATQVPEQYREEENSELKKS